MHSRALWSMHNILMYYAVDVLLIMPRTTSIDFSGMGLPLCPYSGVIYHSRPVVAQDLLISQKREPIT